MFNTIECILYKVRIITCGLQEGFPIRDQFKLISKNAYRSEVLNLDFEKHGAEAQTTINSWASNKTMGKISSVLSDTPDPSTEVIIASALFFSGEWHQHFVEDATKRFSFIYHMCIFSSCLLLLFFLNCCLHDRKFTKYYEFQNS